jgi:hypothetical protein
MRRVENANALIHYIISCCARGRPRRQDALDGKHPPRKEVAKSAPVLFLIVEPFSGGYGTKFGFAAWFRVLRGGLSLILTTSAPHTRPSAQADGREVFSPNPANAVIRVPFRQ